MKKQFQLITPILFMVSVSLTSYGQVGSEFTFNNITYKVTAQDGPKTVTAIGYNTDGGTVVTIPLTVQYQDAVYAVTAIGSGAFRDNDLTEVTIPGSVTNIGIGAFAWNNLAEVTFTGSSNLETIGANAFSHNQLTRIEIPNTANFIGNSAFSYNQLISANIPDGVSVIRNTVFVYNQLASIEIPNSVTTIEISAFGGNNLESVTIPGNVTSIGPWAFANNPALNTVFIKATNPPVVENDIFTTTSPPPHEDRNGQIDLIVPEGAESAYSNWYGGTNYFNSIIEVAKVNDEFTADHITYKITETTPNRQVSATGYNETGGGPTVTIPQAARYQGIDYAVTAIGNDAFKEKQLTSVTMPENVTDIGSWAFASNPNLALVTVRRNDPPTLQDNTFQNPGRGQIDLIVPPGRKQAYLDNDWTGFNSITEARPFITTWAVDAGGSITIPINGNYTYDFAIDWGDNTTTEIATSDPNDADLTHTYTGAGTYEVSIYGVFPALYFNNTGDDMNKIQTVEQWGDIQWATMLNAFYGCSHLDVTATDTPDLSNVTSMRQMFHGATSLKGNEHFNRWDVGKVTDMNSMFREATNFNENIGGWDVGNVTTMAFMFNGATSFNQYIGGWDVSNVTDMGWIFWGASNFNQDIGRWTVSKVIDMGFMFNEATNFNQDIGGWTVSNVTDMGVMFQVASNFNQDIGNWNVSNATNMRFMFAGATNFDQDIGNWNVSNVTGMNSMFWGATNFDQYIGNWDVSKVTDMNHMFSGASHFNQDIGGWDIGNVTDMEAMLDSSALSATNYGATLKAWANSDNTPTSITLGAQDLVYDCDGQEYRQELMDTYGWTFTGDAEGDDKAPGLNLTTQQLTVYLNEGVGTLGLEDDVEVSAEDNCSEVGDLVYSFDAPGSDVTTREFSLDDRGEQTVTLFVSDAYGNAASEDLAVTVVNTATDILSFTIPGQSGETAIDDTAQTIDVEMPFGTDLSLLSPTIGLSAGASANPESGVARDFTSQVSYTVTAEDGITREIWTVTVLKDALATPSSPMIPTAFTPNGDGANDRWIIDHLSADASVRIYDRHGTILFSSNNGYTRPWAGTHRGSILPAGPYLYLVQNGSHKYKGTVTILL